MYNIIWNQFGAALDMLRNAIEKCPDNYWDETDQLWYLAYHTLFWTEYYLDDYELPFKSTTFGHSEFDPKGVKPNRVFSKLELINALEKIKKNAELKITNLNEEDAQKPFSGYKKGYTFTEITLYNMRHIQHHAAQMNILLRQKIDDAPGWVSRVRIKD
ncbi:MAG: DinB family protein [Saprospiraceae bacterium]|nr:DinB family protein [Bacteroidia bacterium]NNE16416.1 DinB family protein [Saprospiraceae bacterium]NNL92608.1 DinB family protein [Saprospiraceae bacterium]